MQKVRVLFLCTGNSCRSEMAEGWARALKGDCIESHSAGTDPHGMNERAVRAMAEAGVDISGHRSKHIDEWAGVPLDYVVTVCGRADQACPTMPGGPRRVHVGFDDPPALARTETTEEGAMRHYRRVRDEIRRFVEGLPGVLQAAPDEVC